MKKRTAALLLTLSFLLYAAGDLAAISINVTGSWSLTIGSGDVVSGPGGDLTPLYTSSADAVTIDVTDTIDNADTWQIQVHKDDLLWHGAMNLSMLRTSDGTGTGSITDGDSLFLDLTSLDQYFFEGAGDRSGIDLQLRLSGVSVLIPADSYSTTIYLTVIDTP